jgi:hypothetical protein
MSSTLSSFIYFCYSGGWAVSRLYPIPKKESKVCAIIFDLCFI